MGNNSFKFNNLKKLEPVEGQAGQEEKIDSPPPSYQ